jgi:hypothetical protein
MQGGKEQHAESPQATRFLLPVTAGKNIQPFQQTSLPLDSMHVTGKRVAVMPGGVLFSTRDMPLSQTSGTELAQWTATASIAQQIGADRHSDTTTTRS